MEMLIDVFTDAPVSVSGLSADRGTGTLFQ